MHVRVCKGVRAVCMCARERACERASVRVHVPVCARALAAHPHQRPAAGERLHSQRQRRLNSPRSHCVHALRSCSCIVNFSRTKFSTLTSSKSSHAKFFPHELYKLRLPSSATRNLTARHSHLTALTACTLHILHAQLSPHSATYSCTLLPTQASPYHTRATPLSIMSSPPNAR